MHGSAGFVPGLRHFCLLDEAVEETSPTTDTPNPLASKLSSGSLLGSWFMNVELPSDDKKVSDGLRLRPQLPNLKYEVATLLHPIVDECRPWPERMTDPLLGSL